MKILYIQLARLGDIYLSWPLLHASLRNPEAEVHFLVRESFKGATIGLDPKIQVHSLDVKSILEPIIQQTEAGLDISVVRLEKVLTALGEESFDRIVNLTFSPLSSFLTHALQTPSTDVRGYTRHADGYLQIPDDSSAYFYAQVGINKPNRFHLTDVLASVAGVELETQDWRGPAHLGKSSFVESDGYFVMHTGGSQKSKRWNDEAWMSLIQKTLERWKEIKVVLIGSSHEGLNLGQFDDAVDSGRLISLFGKTRIEDLFGIVKGAKACIGPDSVAMHVASLVNTPCINLSCRAVNYWETGPVSEKSIVVLKETMDEISVQDALDAMGTFLENGPQFQWVQVVERKMNQPRYLDPSQSAENLSWDLVSAMYCGTALPVLDQMSDLQAFCQIRDLCQLALNEIDKIAEAPQRNSLNMLEVVDSGFETVGTLNNLGGILISWLNTEKIRLGPQPFEQLIMNTQRIYRQLFDFCMLFTGDLNITPEEKIDEVAEMVP